MEPNRIVYSPIVTRPKLTWPRGARIALWVVPNIEHYEYLPRPGSTGVPHVRCDGNRTPRASRAPIGRAEAGAVLIPTAQPPPSP